MIHSGHSLRYLVAHVLVTQTPQPQVQCPVVVLKADDCYLVLLKETFLLSQQAWLASLAHLEVLGKKPLLFLRFDLHYTNESEKIIILTKCDIKITKYRPSSSFFCFFASRNYPAEKAQQCKHLLSSYYRHKIVCMLSCKSGWRWLQAGKLTASCLGNKGQWTDHALNFS